MKTDNQRMLNQVRQENNNKLIAKFLGWKEQTNPTEKWFTQFFNQHGEREGGTNKEPLLFHSDWNWLMLAVEKINDLNYLFTIIDNQSIIKSNETGRPVIDAIRGDMKEGVYCAVIAFVKWHNSTKH